MRREGKNAILFLKVLFISLPENHWGQSDWHCYFSMVAEGINVVKWDDGHQQSFARFVRLQLVSEQPCIESIMTMLMSEEVDLTLWCNANQKSFRDLWQFNLELICFILFLFFPLTFSSLHKLGQVPLSDATLHLLKVLQHFLLILVPLANDTVTGLSLLVSAVCYIAEGYHGQALSTPLTLYISVNALRPMNLSMNIKFPFLSSIFSQPLMTCYLTLTLF